MTDADQLIRAQVRIEQLEVAICDIKELVDTHLINAKDLDPEVFDAIRKVESICLGVRSTPPSPPTEAHIMRDLQAAEDDL